MHQGQTISKPSFKPLRQLKERGHTPSMSPVPRRSASSDKQPAGAGESHDTVLEALIGETHHAASRTIVIASWTNALSTPECAINAPTVMALLPETPAMMVTMHRWIRSSTLKAETLRQTSEFFDSLNEAGKSFDLFMREASQIGLVRSGILHSTLLWQSWRLSLERARDALTAQERETTDGLPSIYHQNARALFDLIQEVEEGATPCLNHDGSIRLPELPNQRRNMRRYILENCLVKTDRQTFTAYARDVSTGGLGLERVPKLPPGKRLTIKLPTGRLFTGRVRWYKNACAGIEFDIPLNLQDPLLSA